MKFNFDMKNKKVGLEADVEKIVEKGMDQKEKDWKDKFNTKHNANVKEKIKKRKIGFKKCRRKKEGQRNSN